MANPTFGTAGRNARTNDEARRWIQVKNCSDIEIPAYAPCLLWYNQGYDPNVVGEGKVPPGKIPIETEFSAYAFKNIDDDRPTRDNYFYRSTLAFNDKTPIPSGATGRVSMDFPAIARCVRYEPSEVDDGDEESPLAQFGTSDYFYMNFFSAEKGQAIDRLTSSPGYERRYSDWLSGIRFRGPQAFVVTGVASVEEDLYWVIPVANPPQIRHWQYFSGSAPGAGPVETVPMIRGSSTDYDERRSATVRATGDGKLRFYYPGAYSFDIFVRLSEKTFEATSALIRGLNTSIIFEHEKSDQVEDFELGPTGWYENTVTFYQPAFIAGIDCDEGYGPCPRLIPAVGEVTGLRGFAMQISAKESWKEPVDGEPSEPLATLELKRNTISIADALPEVTVSIRVARANFQEYYLARFGYNVNWGFNWQGWLNG